MLVFRYRIYFQQCLLFASWIFIHGVILAQRPSISFEHFTSEQGLSAPAWRIVQDKSGFIWLGTSDGLNRFDGRNFVVYRNIAGDSTSLTNNIINSLCTDHLGQVWAATNGGLCYYDFEDDAFHQIAFPDSLEKLDQHRVHSVAPDNQDNIWFATRTYIHRWHKGQRLESIKVPGDDHLQIKYLYIDDKQNVWIGMENGILRYQTQKKIFTNLTVSTAFTLEHHYSSTVHPILPYKGDTLLIGSWYGGLQKVYPDGDVLKSIPYTDDAEKDQRKHIIRGISPGPNGNYWIGTYGDGVSIFNSRTSTFTAHFHHDPSDSKSLSDDYINDVFTDNSGIVWVGTDVGLDKYDPFTQQFQSILIPTFSGEFSVYRIPSSISEEFQHPDQLIITVSGAGIYQYDTNTDEFTLHRNDPKDPNSLPDNSVYTLFRDHQGRRWVGTRSGVCLANEDYTKYSKLVVKGSEFTAGAHEIIEDHDGNIWLASFVNGVFRYNEKTKGLTQYAHDDANPNSLPDDRVFCMLFDHDGMLWIGTQNRGLCRLNPMTGEFINFLHDKNDPHTLPDNGMYDLHEDADHFLWIATENGLAKMDLKNFAITNYSTKDGLCNNDVFSITPDKEGYYWLATNNGISKFDPKNITFKNYFISDGLPTNRLTGSVYYSSNGILYLGTSGKITYCQPSMMQMNRHIPSVVITNFKVFDAREPIMREGPDLEPIKLSYKQNMITFDFAALNFTNSILNQYAYRLEGFDDHWIYCGNKQSATFTNLDGGTYTFHVKAANNDGIWNEEGAKVVITVKSPFWETWWFYLLCVLAISGILYGAYRFRIQQLLRLQQMRLRISRDLHDDIGSTLSSINMISSMAHERNPNDRKVPELFQTIANASHQAMELMNDIVWSINPKNDRMEMILIRMRQYASEILEAAQISFTLDMDDSCHHITIPIEKRKDFYLIFKEAINNMAKYSKAKNATIRMSCLHRILTLSITDDGIGFDPEKIYSGNGLKNMKARAQQLKGGLIIHAQSGAETQIELKIPVTP